MLNSVLILNRKQFFESNLYVADFFLRALKDEINQLGFIFNLKQIAEILDEEDLTFFTLKVIDLAIILGEQELIIQLGIKWFVKKDSTLLREAIKKLKIRMLSAKVI